MERMRETRRNVARGRGVAVVLTTLLALVSGTTTMRPTLAAGQGAQDPISPEASAQIQALMQEKASRTQVQRKIDSQLLYAIKMQRGQPVAAGVQTLQTNVTYAEKRVETDEPRAIVDVTAELTPALIQRFEVLGAQLLDATAGQRSARLAVTAEQIESIAALDDVIFVQPKQDAMTSRQTGPVTPSSRVSDRAAGSAPPPAIHFDPRALTSFVADAIHQEEHGAATNFSAGQGSAASLGEFAHRAFVARGTFHTTGAGIKIGVLSDGVRNLAASQALGDLGPVTVIGNPAPCPTTTTCDEGTAMLEIVHDLAPGAQLYFASAFVSLTDFAQKIRDLQAAGCSIIVDDVGYFVETPFQDGQAPSIVSNTNGGIVAQAVKDVAALGVLYFSSAANSGNLNDGTSGTWEGDFLDAGAAAAPITTVGRLHNFNTPGSPQPSDVLTVALTTAPITLHWSDPLGGSANDYDLFRLDSTGATVLASSTNVQNGTQDPFESVTGTGVASGQRIVVVKTNAAAARFLHLSTNRGRLSIATSGETHGHAATTATGSFGVAATDVAQVGTASFNSTNVVESFSSDGPRRLFFNQAGTAFTPGNVSSTGGILIQKPDFTAADGVAVTGAGGFATPFYGTSAAAPHAAAIAALVKAANPALTQAQIRTALINSAIDIEAPGVDRDSGAGIIMAFQALQAASITGTAFLADSAVTATESPGNGNGVINVGEGAQLSVTLQNVGLQNATNVSATLTSTTPGITVTLPGTSAYPDIAMGATGTNTTPFRFTVASNAACPLLASFTLTVTHTGGGPSVITIPVAIGPRTSILTTLDTTPPAAFPGVTVGTTLQTGRLFRGGVSSSCVAPKPFPGLSATTGSRRADTYGFNTCAENTGGCATVVVNSTGALNLFPVAYMPAYNPTGDLTTNYAADPGVSGEVPFSFSVPAGVGNAAAVVVHEVNPGGGVGTAYTLTVSNLCAGACATPNQVPIARAHNVTVVAGGGGTANASIDNGSSDGDGQPLTITQSPPGPYPLGTTSVLLTVVDPFGATSQATATVTVVNPTMTLTPSTINFGAVSNGNGTLLHQTPPQQIRLTQSGTGTVSWTASANQPWITLNGSSTPISGTGPATLSVAISNAAFSLPNTGTLTATITVNTGGTATNNPTAAVALRIVTNGGQTGPDGSFDTPAHGTTGVVGSIPVTGWAIDDIAVGAVRIMRDPVAGEGPNQIFIGNAVFIAGARPDVAATFPNLPLKDQAGWGLLMLTNFLPNQGNGTFTLYAYADDVDGHTKLLGAKTITCSNATATKPFGAIDTPLQGETVSGTIINFGWALTPQPKAIATDGSTIQVVIDGAVAGNVTYNNARPDIQALFPGYANTNGAVGFKSINTNTLTNGLHTISWVVTDNGGAIEGIGSRFFSVSNSSVSGPSVTAGSTHDTISVNASSVSASADAVASSDRSEVVDAASAVVGDAKSLTGLTVSDAAVAVTHGLADDATAARVEPDADGVRRISVGQLEILRVDLSGGGDAHAVYRGYEVDGNTLKALPVGSTLDQQTGLFSWQPGLAFGGSRQLVFTRTANGVTEKIAVRVSIEAEATHARRMNIDLPRAGDVVGSSFVVGGWAFDGAAVDGAGIDTLHVWAHPIDGSDPIWLGVAQNGGLRPDVGAAFGARFSHSGFGLNVAGLPPGTYDIVVYAHSAASGTFDQAQAVRVTVR
jgi:hypothetical protein